jgi:hypothetical protein
VNQLATGVKRFISVQTWATQVSHSVGVGDLFYKHAACEFDCLTPSFAEVRNEWNYVATLPYAFMACATVTSLYTTDETKIGYEILV